MSTQDTHQLLLEDEYKKGIRSLWKWYRGLDPGVLTIMHEHYATFWDMMPLMTWSIFKENEDLIDVVDLLRDEVANTTTYANRSGLRRVLAGQG